MKKLKLLFSISTLCFALAVLCFGVFAATSVTYNVGGSVSYEVTDVFVKINTRVYKAKTQKTANEMSTDITEIANKTFAEIEALTNEDLTSKYTLTQTMIEFDSSNNLTVESHEAKDAEDKNVEINFEKDAYTYYVVINVQNLSPSKNVYAYMESNLSLADGSNTLLQTNKKQDNISSLETKNIILGFSLEDIKTDIPENLEFSCNIKVDYEGLQIDLSRYGFFDETFGLGNQLSITWCNCEGLEELEFPTSVSKDANGKWINGSDYVITGIGKGDGWRSVLGNTSNLKSIIIPNGITRINDCSLSDCGTLTSITLPESLTYIGSGAFSGCSNIKSVNITSLEKWCNVVLSGGIFNDKTYIYLNGERITDVTIPSSVTSIGNGAFRDYINLTSVTIPSTVTSIGNQAFYGCSRLVSVTIPSSVTSIGNDAFSNTSWLNNIAADSNGLKIVTSSDNVNVKFLLRYTGTISEITAEMLSDVKVICNLAFYNNKTLQSITIPSSVTSIGSYAFNGCSNLTSVTILDGVTSIGESAFYGCSSLTSITIPSSVTSIGSNAFSGCNKLTNVTFEDPNGWSAMNWEGTKSFISTELENTSTNATYLKDTYVNRTWTKTA